jgi:predicted nucleotidyltransferase
MIEVNQVGALVERIARQFQPQRIILFGSYAYGTPDENSDVDLLVIMPYPVRSAGQAIKILNAVAPTFAVDLLVRTPEEMERRLAWYDFFLREIVEKGVVLNDAADQSEARNPVRLGRHIKTVMSGSSRKEMVS